MKSKKTALIVGVATVLVVPFAGAKLVRMSDEQAEIQYSLGQMAKVPGFQSSPVLENVDGHFTFTADNQIIHTNQGLVRATGHGIEHSSSAPHHVEVTDLGNGQESQCRLVNKKMLTVNLRSGEVTGVPASEEFPADLLYDSRYAFPGEMKNRVNGSCGQVILSLDGSRTTAATKPSERNGDIYWEPVKGFIDRCFTSDGSRDRVAIREHKDRTDDRTVEITPYRDPIAIRSMNGVDYQKRLVFTWTTPSGDPGGFCFGRYEDGKVVIEDLRPARVMEQEVATTSLDGKLIAYLRRNNAQTGNEIVILNIKTGDEKVVGQYTTTWISSMMMSPKNTYLALQLPNTVIWKNLKTD